MLPEAQAEHAWLKQFVGEWIAESECQGEPGQDPINMKGHATVEMLGDMWLLVKGEGEMPGGGICSSIITLGYDPLQQRYVGTFIASVMTYLWPYLGSVDASGRKLVLDSQGPRLDGQGDGLIAFRDTIEIIDADHWTLTGEFQADDGSWQQMMTAHYRRA